MPTKGNASAGLSTLEAASYVHIVKGFKGNYPHTTCSLTANGRRAFAAYREHYLALAQRLSQTLT